MIQAHLMCGVPRPVLPHSFKYRRDSAVVVGRFIPTPNGRPVPSSGRGPVRALLSDVAHRTALLLMLVPCFPSTTFKTHLSDRGGNPTARVEFRDGWFWEGGFTRLLLAAMSVLDLVAISHPTAACSWEETAGCCIRNLVSIRAAVCKGPVIELSPKLLSIVSARPRHPLNRGEKLARERLFAGLRSALEQEEEHGN